MRGWWCGWLAVSAVASAEPRLQVAAGSSCDAVLRRELSHVGRLVEVDGELKASLRVAGAAWVLTVTRDGAEPLERNLNAHDCAEAAFAASVVVERYVHELGQKLPSSRTRPNRVEVRPGSPDQNRAAESSSPSSTGTSASRGAKIGRAHV